MFTGVFALSCSLGYDRTYMRLVLELPVREPSHRDLWPEHCRQLAGRRRLFQSVTEAADRLLATSIQPVLGLADTLITTLHHCGGCCGLWLARRRWTLCRAACSFTPSRWRARLWHPGQFETARREEVVLQKCLDTFRLNAMLDELPRKARVEL